ncbi:hypothetical protein Ciccas_006705 [Cichlidogyrus casuarinus]|uniref:Uncharacterized protein n=1 Tax=Cichlidogyrus casuarinus TaxID=1844966 RepID=A0ABD2Q510_9PLAT
MQRERTQLERNECKLRLEKVSSALHNDESALLKKKPGYLELRNVTEEKQNIHDKYKSLVLNLLSREKGLKQRKETAEKRKHDLNSNLEHLRHELKKAMEKTGTSSREEQTEINRNEEEIFILACKIKTCHLENHRLSQRHGRIEEEIRDLVDDWESLNMEGNQAQINRRLCDGIFYGEYIHIFRTIEAIHSVFE